MVVGFIMAGIMPMTQDIVPLQHSPLCPIIALVVTYFYNGYFDVNDNTFQ